MLIGLMSLAAVQIFGCEAGSTIDRGELFPPAPYPTESHKY